jgi:phage terminase large subunit
VFPEFSLVDTMPDGLQKVALGLDFGYKNDPTAVMLCGVKGDTIYIDQLVYETGLVNSDIAKLIPRKIDVYCDSAEPKSVEELRRAGVVRAKAVSKKAGSIISGLSLLFEYKIAITKRSNGLLTEAERYVYKTDGYGNPTNDPIDAFNHGWDAVRYWALSVLSKSETNFWV